MLKPGQRPLDLQFTISAKNHYCSSILDKTWTWNNSVKSLCTEIYNSSAEGRKIYLLKPAIELAVGIALSQLSYFNIV